MRDHSDDRLAAPPELEEAALVDEASSAPQDFDTGDQTGIPASGPPSKLSAAKALGASAAALAVAACGGGGSSNGNSGGSPITGGTPAPTVITPQTEAEASRFLLHASLSASQGEIAALMSDGYEPWLDRQINARSPQSAQEFIAAGGQFYGTAPQVSLESDDQVGRGRLLPSVSVDQYSATLAQWFGVSPSELPLISPNIGKFNSTDLGFLRAAQS